MSASHGQVPPKVRPMDGPTIEITSPTSGQQVTSPFTVSGTVSSGVTSVTLTLQSSVPMVPNVNALVMVMDGTWSYTFTVNSADYTGNTTVTATVTGTQVSTDVTFQITG